MEENKKQSNVTINISGGHNIVQPNATQATMIINGNKATVEEELQDDSTSLASENIASSQQLATVKTHQLPESAVRLRKYVAL